MFENYPDVVSVDDLQEMLGIGKNTAYKLVKDKIIKSVQIGRQHKIPKCYIIDFLLNNEQTQPTM
jgi:excisionase family DNA binding protein